jgi:hypothetical protein
VTVLQAKYATLELKLHQSGPNQNGKEESHKGLQMVNSLELNVSLYYTSTQPEKASEPTVTDRHVRNISGMFLGTHSPSPFDHPSASGMKN